LDTNSGISILVIFPQGKTPKVKLALGEFSQCFTFRRFLRDVFNFGDFAKLVLNTNLGTSAEE